MCGVWGAGLGFVRGVGVSVCGGCGGMVVHVCVGVGIGCVGVVGVSVGVVGCECGAPTCLPMVHRYHYWKQQQQQQAVGPQGAQDLQQVEPHGRQVLGAA